MSRKRGGGYGMGAPLVGIPTGPGSDWNFSVKQPINQGFDDCLFPARTGQLFNQPNPGLAQASWPFAGGRRRRGSRRGRGRKMRGGALADEQIQVGETVFFHFNIGDFRKYTITEIAGEGDDDNITFSPEGHDGPVKMRTRRDVKEATDLAKTEGELTNQDMNVPPPPPGQPQLLRGGSRDANEISHAYPDDGWYLADKAGSSVATTYGPASGLAQTVMVGGGDPSPFIRPSGWSTPSLHGGTQPEYGPNTGLAQVAMAGGRRRRGRRGSKRQRGGRCGCMGAGMFGGRRTRRMRGGASNGYAVIPSLAIGGSGPNVAALHAGVPCDYRAGAGNAFNPAGGSSDPRAYGMGYSLTPNSTTPSLQAGGSYSGNAYAASCYRAPGSELPTYEAQTAGFNFRPSTLAGGTLPDGITAYNDVVPYAARMGGGRRRKSRRGRRAASRASRTGRKH